jgi:hypothetical protein
MGLCASITMKPNASLSPAKSSRQQRPADWLNGGLTDRKRRECCGPDRGLVTPRLSLALRRVAASYRRARRKAAAVRLELADETADWHEIAGRDEGDSGQSARASHCPFRRPSLVTPESILS